MNLPPLMWIVAPVTEEASREASKLVAESEGIFLDPTYTAKAGAGLIDHLLITTDALHEYGDGTTEVLYLEDTVAGYQALISDHRPVLTTFIVK